MTAPQANPVLPRLSNTRPTIPLTGTFPTIFGETEFRAYLATQGKRYRTDPIYIEAGSMLEGNVDQPLIAGTALCPDSGTIAGSGSPSPRALIRDRWHDLAVTVTDPVVLTTSTPASFGVTGVDRDLPQGFVLGFDGGANLVMLAAAAASGATSLSLTKIYNNVNIADNSVGIARNGYFFQNGTGCPNFHNLFLVGDPNPMMNDPRTQEATRKYSCDGIALAAAGAVYDNVFIYNFPGHALWCESAIDSNTFGGPSGANKNSHLDFFEVNLKYVNCNNCLSGITINASDGKFGTLIASGCRDYGVKLNGANNQGDKIHVWGCGTGAIFNLGGHADHVEGENNNYGVNILTSPCEFGTIKVWDNSLRGLYIDTYETMINSIQASHATAFDSGSDPFYQTTGFAVIIKDFCDRLMCPAMFAKATAGAQGVRIGINHDHTMVGTQLQGSILGDASPGEKGLYLRADMSGCKLEFHVGGFAKSVYVEDDVTLAGNKIDLYGTSATTIRWDDTNLTFADGVPANVSTNNDVTLHVY